MHADQVELLTDSVPMLKAALNAVPDPVVWTGLDGSICGCNAAFERLAGPSRSQILGSQLPDLLPLQQAGQQLSAAAYPDHRVRRGEYQPTRYDLSWGDCRRVFEILAQSVTSVDRDSLVVLVLRECPAQPPARPTDRPTEGEQPLLQLALDAGQMGIWDWNVQTNEIQWTSTLEEIYGVTPDSSPRTLDDFLQVIDPRDLARVRESIARTVESGTDYTIEFRIRWPDGTARWVAARGRMFRDAEDQAQRLVGLVMDVTEAKCVEAERKQAEAALRRSELKYRNLFENSQIGIFRSRLEDGLILEANQRFIEMSGYPSAAAVIGQCSTREFYPHPDDRQAVIDELQRHGRLNNLEMQYRHRDGSLHWGLFSLYVNTEEGCIDCVATDISEAKRAEEALREAKEAAEAANRAKSTFLATMSHELRTPLNAILGFTQLMERDTVLVPRQREFLATINRSGEHLLDLINDVLEMSKIEAGQIVLHPSSFDLHHCLRTLQEMFKIRAQGKGLSLHFEIGSEVPQYVLTDEGKLRQVLINLLGNAVKFTNQGGVALRLQTQQVTEPDQQSVRLIFEVQDTGRGIPPEETQQLFQPFVQATRGAQSQEGTGLGLAISRQFVQLMGGEISLASQVGQGSCFRFEIPVHCVESPTEKSEPDGRCRPVGLAPGQPSYRILVVDDKPDNQASLIQLLQMVGFETQAASDGQEAIAQWQQWQPHLIWMDMRMPVLDGYQATRQIRHLEQAQPSTSPTIILALTASAFEEQRRSILSAGCDDWVCKPFREQVIFEKMATYLGVKYLDAEPLLASVSQPHNCPSACSLVVEHLGVMTADWITALHQAALEVDADRLYQLIHQIPAANHPLTDGLTQLVNHYCFDEILDLTQGCSHGE